MRRSLSGTGSYPCHEVGEVKQRLNCGGTAACDVLQHLPGDRLAGSSSTFAFKLRYSFVKEGGQHRVELHRGIIDLPFAQTAVALQVRMAIEYPGEVQSPRIRVASRVLKSSRVDTHLVPPKMP